MLKFNEIKYKDYHRVVEATDDDGFRAIVAIHNINLGVALGGCRVMSYEDRGAQLTDALNLAKGMTYKNSLAGLDLGGGKATINAPKATQEVLNKFADVMEYINRDKMVYITAGDVGTGPGEIAYLSSRTGYVNGQNMNEDSGFATAFGVCMSMMGAAAHAGMCYRELRVAIEGLGKVGMRLSKFLDGVTPRVFAYDPSKEAMDTAFRDYGVVGVDHLDRAIQQCNTYAPCALGGSLDISMLNKLQAGDIVCGGANNQFLTSEMPEAFRQKGIICVPDYLANAGGVIIVAKNYTDRSWTDPEVYEKLRNLKFLTQEVLRLAKNEGVTPLTIADKMAEERFGA